MSDVHLGSKWSKAKEANRFLKYHTCDTLILCGDIIDGWELLRGRREKWKRRHTNFISRLLDLQHDTRIIYLRGNHDDFLDRILPLQFEEGQSVESLGLDGTETFTIAPIDFSKGLPEPAHVAVEAVKPSGEKTAFNMIVRIDTPTEGEYYFNGGILQYVLRSLA